jgi:histidine triad (HIT) family protein
MTSTNCVFCAIVARRAPATIVFEDERHVAFFPLEHMNPGHTVLIPKRHVEYVFDLEEADYVALWAAAAKLAPGLREVTAAKRVGILVEGYTVPHVHVHLVPTYAFNEIEAARQRKLAADETERLATALRAAFKQPAAS